MQVTQLASDDNFVLAHHTEDLHRAWGGSATLATFNGGHNGARPPWFLKQAFHFLQECFANPAPRKSTRGMSQGLPKSVPVPAPTAEPQPIQRHSASAPTPTCDAAGEALAADLVAMGFGEDAAFAAAARCSTAEAAVDWILQEAHAALGTVNGPTLRLPGSARLLEPDTPAAANLASQEVTDLTGVASALEKLGFAAEDACEAARRCSSVEAGVDWILNRQ